MKKHIFNPFFGNFNSSKSARIKPANFKAVISKVREIEKKNEPTNSSYNPSAIITDTDLALEQARRRETQFNFQIQKEISKLHSKILKLESPSDASSQTRSLKASPVSQEKSYYKLERLKTQTPTPFTKKSTRISTNLYTRESRTRYSKPEKTNPAIAQVDKVIKDCSVLQKDVKSCRETPKSIRVKSSDARAKLDLFLDSRKTIEVSDLTDSKYFEADLKIAAVCARKRKIWKMNHIAFIALVDRKLNSITGKKDSLI